MKKSLLFFVLLLGCSQLAWSDSFRTTASSDAIQVGYRMNFPGPFYGDINYVHNYDNSDDLVNAGLYAEFSAGVIGGRVGAKTFYAEVDDEDGWGLAPGVGAYIKPLPMLTLSADYFTAPSSMTSGDIEGYDDWSVKATFSPAKYVHLYAGYGDLEVETERRGNVNYDEGMFYGAYFSLGF